MRPWNATLTFSLPIVHIFSLYHCILSLAKVTLPFNKYSKTYAIDSKSSLLLGVIPMCTFTLAYLAVPVNFLPCLIDM